mgnify:CR=1 FL=1
MKSINKEILKLAIPSILANITVPIVGMVDIAVAGHLTGEVATMIGGIAIGTMLFDLLYWNFGFLRVGTGGLTAQACGRKDDKECAKILTRALGISLAFALVLIAIQWIFVKAAFCVVDCTPEVRELASKYFFIRIWAAPATLSLMAFKGWFIGMQDSVSPMVTDFVVNGMNVLMSIVLALGIPAVGGWSQSDLGVSAGDMIQQGGQMWFLRPMGFTGIALGTVVAQYSGLLTAIIFLAVKYFRRVFADFHSEDLKGIFAGPETRRFFVMNTDLFVRSLCFIAIYIGFTTISAGYGDLLLAVSRQIDLNPTDLVGVTFQRIHKGKGQRIRIIQQTGEHLRRVAGIAPLQVQSILNLHAHTAGVIVQEADVLTDIHRVAHRRLHRRGCHDHGQPQHQRTEKRQNSSFFHPLSPS